MEPDLSKYEIIYETLTASDTDSDSQFPKDSLISQKNKKVKKRVVKNFIICQPIDPKKKFADRLTNYKVQQKTSAESAEKEFQIVKQNWQSVVNFVDGGIPSMSKIEEVIERTINKVLLEELPTKFGKSVALKNCPHCKFSTFSEECLIFKKSKMGIERQKIDSKINLKENELDQLQQREEN